MIKNWHSRLILPGRQDSLAKHITGVLIEAGIDIGSRIRILDVGCGDGAVAAQIKSLCGEGVVEGVETRKRGGEPIPVQLFDGQNLPFPDGSFDIVVLCDVLHHLGSFEKKQRLFSEGMRVAKIGVCVKDHVEVWLPDHLILSAMDFVGNVGRGVPLPCNYLDPQQWERLLSRAGARWQVRRQSPLGLHPQWASWLTEKTPWGTSLHFVGLARRVD
jgi:SAM-dependent methyltransferase